MGGQQGDVEREQVRLAEDLRGTGDPDGFF